MSQPEELNDDDRRPGVLPRPDKVKLDARGNRTTESALAFPAWGHLFTLIGRAIRLRCPNCGNGPVLKGYATVNDRCRSCGFRFTRSTDAYFSGAMLTNLAVAEGLFALVFAITIISSWPDVPWDTLTWAMPLGIALAPALLLPFAKVFWLTFDVAFRPVTPEEIEAPTR